MQLIPRMTTRRWMGVVAVIGLMLGGGIWLKERRRSFESLAAYHKSMRVSIVSLQLHGHVRHLETVAEWHDALAAKYRHAARHPWLPVAPDPPEP